MNNIEKDINELVEGFTTLKAYNDFILVKEARLTDSEFLRLQSELKEAKSEIKILANNPVKLSEHLLKTKELEDEFLSHPLNVNYNVYKEAILELVDPLLDIFK